VGLVVYRLLPSLYLGFYCHAGGFYKTAKPFGTNGFTPNNNPQSNQPTHTKKNKTWRPNPKKYIILLREIKRIYTPIKKENNYSPREKEKKSKRNNLSYRERYYLLPVGILPIRL